VTDDDIEQLGREAAAAGDSAMADLCESALVGDRDAHRECERAIYAAAAMCDDE